MWCGNSRNLVRGWMNERPRYFISGSIFKNCGSPVEVDISALWEWQAGVVRMKMSMVWCRLRGCLKKDLLNCDCWQNVIDFVFDIGTIVAVFILRRLQEEYRAKGEKLYMYYVDLEKALDTVPRNVLEWIMGMKGIPEVLVRVVTSLSNGAKTRFLWRVTIWNEVLSKTGISWLQELVKASNYESGELLYGMRFYLKTGWSCLQELCKASNSVSGELLYGMWFYPKQVLVACKSYVRPAILWVESYYMECGFIQNRY